MGLRLYRWMLQRTRTHTHSMHSHQCTHINARTSMHALNARTQCTRTHGDTHTHSHTGPHTDTHARARTHTHNANPHACTHDAHEQTDAARRASPHAHTHSAHNARTLAHSQVSGSSPQRVVAKANTPWASVDGCGGGSAVAVWLQMFDTGRYVRHKSSRGTPAGYGRVRNRASPADPL